MTPWPHLLRATSGGASPLEGHGQSRIERTALGRGFIKRRIGNHALPQRTGARVGGVFVLGVNAAFNREFE